MECNVYFNEMDVPLDCLEGEDFELVEAPMTTAPVPTDSSIQPPTNNDSVAPPKPLVMVPEDTPREQRVRKPSQRILDLINGRAVHSNRRNDPILARGIQAPTAPTIVERTEFEGEGSAEQIMSLMDDEFEELAMVSEISEAEGLDPSSLADAKRHPDWLDWEKAIQEELTLLKETGTWVLVDPPPGANIVGSKWVFRVKKDADGNIIRKKARLVAQGFSQVPGVDYFDTFVSVARLATNSHCSRTSRP